MRAFQNTLDFYSDSPSAVTLGKFDGVHLGHQKLLGQITACKEHGLSAIAFVIAPPHLPRLFTFEEEKNRMEELGIDLLIECPFVPEILTMDPDTFVRQILKEKLQAEYLTVGADFHFGHQRSGDAEFLKKHEKDYGLQVDVIPKVCRGDREISSTYVREALEQGRIELVNELLGSPFSVTGTVLHGHRLGRTIGMPTVNLIPDAMKLLPPFGVYFARVWVGGAWYCGITNIGTKPTVDGSFVGVETYLCDFSGDLYDQRITVELLHYRRPEMRFSDIEELKHQMQQDIQAGKEYFSHV